MAEAEELAQATEQGIAEAEISLIDEITRTTSIQGLRPSDEGYDIARRGVEEFIAELLKSTRKEVKVEKLLVDKMIAEIDKKLSMQVDEILHHSTFQQLESAWRGLKLVVDRTNFRENIKLEILNVSKQDLLADFEDAPEVTKSGLYKQV